MKFWPQVPFKAILWKSSCQKHGIQKNIKRGDGQTGGLLTERGCKPSVHSALMLQNKVKKIPNAYLQVKQRKAT